MQRGWRGLAALVQASFAFVACSESDNPSLIIEDADGRLVGTVRGAPTGSVTFPEPFWIGFYATKPGPYAGDVEFVGVRGGSVEPVGTANCHTTQAVHCTSGVCLVEMVTTDAGTCLLRVHATTVDGDAVAACAYRALVFGDGPALEAQVHTLVASANAALATCEDGL